MDSKWTDSKTLRPEEFVHCWKFGTFGKYLRYWKFWKFWNFRDFFWKLGFFCGNYEKLKIFILGGGGFKKSVQCFLNIFFFIIIFIFFIFSFIIIFIIIISSSLSLSLSSSSLVKLSGWVLSILRTSLDNLETGQEVVDLCLEEVITTLVKAGLCDLARKHFITHCLGRDNMIICSLTESCYCKLNPTDPNL